MIDRRRPSHLVLTLAPDAPCGPVPAHVDVLMAGVRPAGSLDGGRLDRTLSSCGGAFRAARVFHARRNLGRVGSRALGYDDLEEELGLSRTYRVQLADADGVGAAVRRLREDPVVEGAGVECFATAAAAVATSFAPTAAEIGSPHRMVRAAEARAREAGDERVTVAVVDTGVSLGHPEFQRKLLSGWDAVELGLGRISDSATLVGDSHGRDFSPTDDVGHGSHVAGIIGAQGWQLPSGIAGRSLLLPIRVLAGAQTLGTDSITGVGAMGDIDAGLKVAVDLGARVINMSFGTPANALDPAAPRPHQMVIEYAVRNGCVLVAASGNSGAAEDFWPAADEHVIAVGSVGPEGRRSPFTTYGPHLALSAPGEDITSVGRYGYRRSTGTSHAAPFVAGAAALLVAHARRAGRELTPVEVRDLMTSTAQTSPSSRDEVGAGVLDIAAALDALDRQPTDHPATTL